MDGSLTGREPDRDFYVACNGWIDPLRFRIPPSPSARMWRRVIDTAQASPFDILPEDLGPVVPSGSYYTVQAHSMLVLVSRE